MSVLSERSTRVGLATAALIFGGLCAAGTPPPVGDYPDAP